MSMDRLNDDVLLIIMGFLELRDVMSFTQSCKRINALGLSSILNRKLDFKGNSRCTQEELAAYLGNRHRALRVQQLNLEHIFWVSSGLLRTAVQKMTNLSHLFVLDTQLSHNHLREILSVCPAITHLSWTCDLHAYQLGEATAVGQQLKNLKSVKLHLSTYIFPHNVLVSLLSCCLNLGHLSLYATVPAFLTSGERPVRVSSLLPIVPLPQLQELVLKVTFKDWFSRPVFTRDACDFVRACAQSSVVDSVKERTFVCAEKGMRVFWNMACSPIARQMDLFTDDYCFYYGTDTREACMCVTAGPPTNPANANKVFSGHTLFLCLHAGCDHSYLPSLLARYENLKQLKLSTQKYSGGLDSWEVIESDVQKRLNETLMVAHKLEALELTYAHTNKLQGVMSAIKNLTCLRRLCVAPCIFVGPRDAEAPDVEMDAVLAGDVSTKRRRVSLQPKSQYASVLKQLAETNPYLETLEIMSPQHEASCSVCKTEDFSEVCRDIALFPKLRNLQLDGFTCSNGNFFQEMIRRCTKLESLRLKSLAPLARCMYSDQLRSHLPQCKSLRLLRWEQRNVGDPSKTLECLSHLPSLRRVALVHKQEMAPLKNAKPIMRLIAGNNDIESLFFVFAGTTEKLCKDVARSVKEYRRSLRRQNLFFALRNTYDQGPDEQQYARLMPTVFFDDFIVNRSRVLVEP